VPLPRDHDRRNRADYFVASEDADNLTTSARALVERAVGMQWYDRIDNEADRAALALCRLRRAGAGVGGATSHGDDAVRRVLETVSPAALAWIASRAISYMDENGYPEAVEPWLGELARSTPEDGGRQ
jgi:hypothetical protein